MANFIAVLGFAVLIAQANAKNIGNTGDDIVWFPNPIDDGTLIPARLTPSPTAMAGNVSEMHFLLHTNKNQGLDEYQEIMVDDLDSVDKSHFDPAHPVKMLIHGFGGVYDDPFPAKLREAYVSDEMVEQYNVIVVNWTSLADSPDYFTAVANAQIVSEQSAKLLKFLVDSGKTGWDNVHLIGFSLGGQVVGQIGWRVQQLGGEIARITSLDPAMPLFDVLEPENCTGPEDAKFVDVIHTSANGILGVWDPIGTVDFYPNGGRYQPGCGVDITGSCGHSRAPAYFTESVFTKTEFWGRECDTYENFQSGACDGNEQQIMGHYTPETTTSKIYFLNTKAEKPFAEGPLPK